MFIQVNVPEKIGPMGRALQGIVEVAAVVARVIQQSLPDRLIITKGASELRHVVGAHA